jgi:hypothetical protein
VSSSSTSIWLETTGAISVAAGCFWLHLRWHPQRREFSDSWDFVSGMPWLVVLHGMLLTLAQLMGQPVITGSLVQKDLAAWRELGPALFSDALQETAALGHCLLPPWPLALLLPPVLGILLWLVARHPYRFGIKRRQARNHGVLGAFLLPALGWLLLESSSAWRGMLPEGLENTRLALRLLFQAATAACCQAFLVQLVIAWNQPERPDSGSDFITAFVRWVSRWREVLLLAVLDLMILLLQGSGAGGPARWLLLELTLLFLPLPVALALAPAPFARQGLAALQCWRRSFLPIVSVLLTGAVLISLTRYASAMVQSLTGVENGRYFLLLPVHGLVLATVRNWVFLALTLALIRPGLIPPSRRGRSAS